MPAIFQHKQTSRSFRAQLEKFPPGSGRRQESQCTDRFKILEDERLRTITFPIFLSGRIKSYRKMGMADEVSLRPLSLRPGAGVNPFASFANGAGMNMKNKVRESKTIIIIIMKTLNCILYTPVKSNRTLIRPLPKQNRPLPRR